MHASDDYAVMFPSALTENFRRLGMFGLYQRLAWINETKNSNLLNVEIQKLQAVIPDLIHLRIKPVHCTFHGNQNLSNVSKSNLNLYFTLWNIMKLRDEYQLGKNFWYFTINYDVLIQLTLSEFSNQQLHG